jgi:hypothetical protein
MDGKMKAISENVLKRPLTNDEELELLRISEAMGMSNVQSFLYLMLVFKLHEDATREQFKELSELEGRLNGKFDEMGELEKKIHGTLESSIERILGEGAAKIGEGIGDEIAVKAGEALSSLKEFHTIRGFIVAASVSGIVSSVAYWLGATGLFRMSGIEWPFNGILTLPAGWWMLFCFAAYTYFWCFDNWRMVKASAFYKGLLVFQGVIMAVLLLSIL